MSWIFLHLSDRMRIIKSSSSIFCTLFALGLFSLAVSITMGSPNDGKDYQEYSISRKGAIPSNPDNQLPYEERETEDDELQDNFSLVCFISEPVFFTLINDKGNCRNKTQNAVNAITDIPLYLSKRVLLI